jgi:hypothetical protein
MDAIDLYTFRVEWSEDDQEYVGLCEEFPSLSWLDVDKVQALFGIKQVVIDSLADINEHKESM